MISQLSCDVTYMDQVLSVSGLQVGNGPRALFVPGLGESASSWERTLKEIENEFSSFAVTLPVGYGQRFENFFDPEQYGNLLANILESIGDVRYLVGHSIGGSICLYADVDPSIHKIIIEQSLDLRPFAALVRPLWHRLNSREYQAAFSEEGGAFDIESLDKELKEIVLSSRRNLSQGAIVTLWKRLIDMSDDQLIRFMEQKIRLNRSQLTFINAVDVDKSYKQWIEFNSSQDVNFISLDCPGHWPHITNPKPIAHILRQIKAGLVNAVT